MLYYLIIIGFVSSIFFIGDKQKAKKKKYRFPEKTLHFMEFAGGIFAILPLMYIIRHKNRKAKYYIWSYIAFVSWILFLVFWIGFLKISMI